MGLDFTIYAKRKNAEFNEDGFPVNEDDLVELAYGRKSWELVRALKIDYNLDGFFYPVEKENWDELMKTISNLIIDTGAQFGEIYKAYEEEEIYMNNPDLLEDKYKRIIHRFEYFYDKAFDEGPILGYEFALGYIINFKEANPKVQEYYNKPDWEIVAEVSY